MTDDFDPKTNKKNNDLHYSTVEVLLAVLRNYPTLPDGPDDWIDPVPINDPPTVIDELYLEVQGRIISEPQAPACPSGHLGYPSSSLEPRPCEHGEGARSGTNKQSSGGAQWRRTPASQTRLPRDWSPLGESAKNGENEPDIHHQSPGAAGQIKNNGGNQLWTERAPRVIAAHYKHMFGESAPELLKLHTAQAFKQGLTARALCYVMACLFASEG